MILNTSSRIDNGAGDYIVLVDYGSEGFSIMSQHQNIMEAITARDNCHYGVPMAIVKLCRIQDPIEI